MNIAGVVQKKGQTYRRFRIRQPDGRYKDHYVKLPDPSHPDFSAALERVNARPEARPGPRAGSMRALAIEFRAALAAGWTKKRKKAGAKALAASTRANYLRYVDMIEVAHGDELVANLRRANVYKLRDNMAATPGKANNWLNVLTIMLEYACERDWITTNPAAGISKLAIGEHEPWPRHVLEDALEKASPMLRLAIVSGLCSGQRVSDVIRIQHGWLRGGILELSQVKTAVGVAVPVHPWWREEIDKVEKRSITLLYDRAGKPFASEDRIQERIRRLMHDLGYVDDEGQLLYTFHGLRKNAACYMAELGLSDTEIGSVCGMSPDTVRHYTKRARAYVIARKVAGVLAAANVTQMTR
nr:hypothetical protein GCM10017606_29730 [Microbacterium terregens]